MSIEFKTLLKMDDIHITKSERGAICYATNNTSAAMSDLFKRVTELQEHIKSLEQSLGNKSVDVIANFGAYLVDNHESKFEGGEDQIVRVCSEFAEQLETKPNKDYAAENQYNNNYCRANP